jgi:hypothetical protein
MNNKTGFPHYLEDLFLKFSIAYENLWTYALKTERDLLAKKLMWHSQICTYPDHAILSAIDLAIKHFPKPPSIKEFLDLCSTETKRLKPEGLQLTDNRRDPPSPLLAEYMAKNPEQVEMWTQLGKQYSGKELGTAYLKIIKEKLAEFKRKKNDRI